MKSEIEENNVYREKLTVITGKGKNSINGPVIKPMIQQYLIHNNYDYSE